MLAWLDHPYRKLDQRVLIVGTNGKGSVAATLSAITTSAGRKTGLFTSPHLTRVTERFRINDKDFSWADFDRVGGRVLDAIDKANIPLSFFEAMVTTALLGFEESGCTVGIIEAGLGGKRDGTRPIEPTHAVLTSLGLDHTKTLGPTLTHIAHEKLDVFSDGAKGIVALPPKLEHLTPPGAWRYNQEVRWRQRPDGGLTVYLPDHTLRLPAPALPGPHQRRNTALAAATAHRMGLTEAEIAEGVPKVRWPGRMQKLATGPDTWLDGAHNPQAVNRLLDTLTELNIEDGYTLVFGAHPFKNTRHLLNRLAARAGTVITTTAERLSPAAELAELLPDRPDVHVQPHVHKAVLAARRLGKPVLVAGSLYLAGALLGHLENHPLN
ncbi:MAG: dihydrofolate synthase/folylpolyglutamate synthase [Myxococcota bacterium]|jgi:dihydrofolate synthase/folylpolyglutamate synthase